MIKSVYFVGVCFFITFSGFAQLETASKFGLFKKIEKLDTASSSIDFTPRKVIGLTTSKNPNYASNFENLGKEESQFSITTDDGFLDTKTDKAPRGFEKTEKESQVSNTNQYLGDFKTKSNYATIQYRDHEYVDGDRVRIFINEDVVKHNVTLQGSFNGFTFPLQDGFNKIDFQALNQGDSGPNTAELVILDEDGKVLFSNRWNLATGYTATVIIVKE
jgi:hypothetical protein